MGFQLSGLRHQCGGARDREGRADGVNRWSLSGDSQNNPKMVLSTPKMVPKHDGGTSRLRRTHSRFMQALWSPHYSLAHLGSCTLEETSSSYNCNSVTGRSSLVAERNGKSE